MSKTAWNIRLGLVIAVRQAEREAAIIMEQQLAYTQVNQAFLLLDREIVSRRELNIERNGIYKPLPEVNPETNRFGIIAEIYLLLIMYELRTGNVLTYETVVDYFSQEYEPDGSLRLHNNGKHPEISAFVEWMWEGFHWRGDYDSLYRGIGWVLRHYTRANENNGFIIPQIEAMSPQMLREIVPVAIDSNQDYLRAMIANMTLTRLQQQGY